MKHLAASLILSLLTLSSVAHSSGTRDEYLGQCKMENGDFLVYQNKSQNIFKFLLVSAEQSQEVIFDRSLTWLWYEADASFWKFRNGRHNGVFSWNFNSLEGHLKYVKGDYHYWHLTDCNINERAISY